MAAKIRLYCGACRRLYAHDDMEWHEKEGVWKCYKCKYVEAIWSRVIDTNLEISKQR